MKSSSFGSFAAKYAAGFGIFGFVIGIILFILYLAGIRIPVVIGTETYEGIVGSLFLLFASPVALSVIGFIISIFAFSARRK
ncbi:hypothetical protein [Paenibacillus sp. NEAU-GSW1]|uniref:hypothetical protein n=1 Tax=Paenibacillus sp. NEAU-GSW1 TaxID=2682486 RepID=UPI0012E30289|nr:hypothetical protein [Paenibacillus sp. NEAU-GSW1]MUT66983.1 hypothetical protein [Paenibacillus sp. NEAU-GSW1]